MVNVRIKDYVEYAYTYEEGQKIFDIIFPLIAKGEKVSISFDGIKAVPSSFVNSAILQLLQNFSIDQIRSSLMISDSTVYINDVIKIGFDTAINKKLDKNKNPN